MYQQIRLSDTSMIGTPGSLPYAVAGWTDDLLRDLSQIDPSFGLAGMAFWPVVVTTPAYDATRQVAEPPASYAIDPKACTVTGAATVRDMTAAEYAVANPPPPVSGDAIIGAIAKADRVKCDATDLARIAWRDDVPAGNAKLGRIAKALGTTPDALRAAAVG